MSDVPDLEKTAHKSSSTKPLKIELWTDIVCPWCIIGQHRLDKVLAERFSDLAVDIEHHPFELHPAAPPEGFRTEDYRRQRGLTNPDEVRRIYAMIEGEALSSGLTLKLGQPFIYRTVHAHTLLRHARARGTQHALSKALMEAFFFASQNISDKLILAEIAGQYGFQGDDAIRILNDTHEQIETERQIDIARENGVRSVPTFNIGGVMMGGGSEEQLAAAIAHANRK